MDAILILQFSFHSRFLPYSFLRAQWQGAMDYYSRTSTPKKPTSSEISLYSQHIDRMREENIQSNHPTSNIHINSRDLHETEYTYRDESQHHDRYISRQSYPATIVQSGAYRLHQPPHRTQPPHNHEYHLTSHIPNQETMLHLPSFLPENQFGEVYHRDHPSTSISVSHGFIRRKSTDPKGVNLVMSPVTSTPSRRHSQHRTMASQSNFGDSFSNSFHSETTSEMVDIKTSQNIQQHHQSQTNQRNARDVLLMPQPSNFRSSSTEEVSNSRCSRTPQYSSNLQYDANPEYSHFQQSSVGVSQSPPSHPNLTSINSAPAFIPLDMVQLHPSTIQRSLSLQPETKNVIDHPRANTHTRTASHPHSQALQHDFLTRPQTLSSSTSRVPVPDSNVNKRLILSSSRESESFFPPESELAGRNSSPPPPTYPPHPPVSKGAQRKKSVLTGTNLRLKSNSSRSELREQSPISNYDVAYETNLPSNFAEIERNSISNSFNVHPQVSRSSLRFDLDPYCSPRSSFPSTASALHYPEGGASAPVASTSTTSVVSNNSQYLSSSTSFHLEEQHSHQPPPHHS